MGRAGGGRLMTRRFCEDDSQGAGSLKMKTRTALDKMFQATNKMLSAMEEFLMRHRMSAQEGITVVISAVMTREGRGRPVSPPNIPLLVQKRGQGSQKCEGVTSSFVAVPCYTSVARQFLKKPRDRVPFVWAPVSPLSQPPTSLFPSSPLHTE